MLECLLDIADVLEFCGKIIPVQQIEVVQEWRSQRPDRQPVDPFELICRISDDPEKTRSSTTQLRMNVSSGKNGIKKYVAWASMLKAFGQPEEAERAEYEWSV